MENGICLQSIIPVRSSGSHRAEMVSQLLFGELYTITDREEGWMKIRCFHDGYEGWIHELQAFPLDDEEFSRLAQAFTPVTLDLVQLLSDESGHTLIPLLLGSSLPGLDGPDLRIGSNRYFFEGQVSEQSVMSLSGQSVASGTPGGQLISDAMLYLNAPYLWGGRSPFGLDCSGFTQMVYKLHGITLARDASQQAGMGEGVAWIAEAEAGDLAFFENPDGEIIHVGMLTSRSTIIHCSGKVRIDPLDHQGIFSESQQRYTHNLRLIRRIL